MRIAVIIVRVLTGALFVFSSVAYFLQLFPTPALQGNMKEFNEGLIASGYVLPVVKSVELLCGLALLSGFFVPLAAVVLFPVTLNIFCVHLFLAPEGLPVAVFIMAANLFLFFVHRAKYMPLLSAR